MANKILDPAKNFGIVTCSGSYTSTNTLVYLKDNGGTRLPSPAADGNYNITWWNYTDYKNPSDDPKRSVVRCTNKTTSSVTITQPSAGNTYLLEGSENVAQSHSASGKVYKMSLSWSKRNADYVDAFLDRTGMHATSATSSGTDAYIISVSGGITAYRPGQIFTFKANTYNRSTVLIEDCEDAWTPAGGWTTCSTDTNCKYGSYSAKNVCSLGVLTAAYEVTTLNLNISSHKVIGLWTKVNGKTSATNVQFGVSEGNTGYDGSGQYWNLAAMSTNTWTYQVLEMTNAASSFDAINSVHIGHNMGSSLTIWLDDIRAYPAVNINSLGYKVIKRNGGGTLVTGDIRANKTVSILYTDENYFELINAPADRTGDIKIVPYSSIPDGWLQCDGKTFSSTIYPELYDVIGTTFGAGPNTPNLKARVICGLDAVGGDTGFDGIGDSGGVKTVTLSEAQMPQHGGHVAGTTTVRKANSSYDSTVVQSVTTENKGSSNAHTNLQPYLVLNYIIKT